MSAAALDYERARSALTFIPPDDRDLWVRMGMALKEGFDDEGFNLWDAWSRKSDRYNERDARDVWRSVKVGGGITLGTLFHEAKAGGWHDDGTHQKPTAEELEARRRQAAERAAKENAERAREHARAAKQARAVCAIATSAREPHPYLIRKGLAGVEGLREVHAAKMLEILGYRPQARGETLVGRLLVVPVKVGDELSTVELIDETGRKSFLHGGAAAGGFWAQERPDGDGAGITILIAEGVATSLSAREASGHPVIAALSSRNILAVAKAMRERYPKAALGILAELGNGQKDAEEAAQATGSALVLPDFGENWLEGATDLNDMHQHRGPEAVAECIEAQMGAHAAQEDVQADTADAKAERDTKTEPGLTDLGNAHRFAREHRRDIRYCWPWAKWLVWNSRFWAHDETGEIHRLAEATVRGMYEEAAESSSKERRERLGIWAVRCESHERRAKMLASAQAIAGIPVRPAELDRDPWLLNVRNGTIDLRTGTLRQHAREDLITRGIDVDYDPVAVCPTWERFIDEVFGSNAETIAFVQRAIGYSLTGDVREHAFFIAHGVGSNGKSTLLDTVHGLLAAYAGRVPAELLMVRRGEHHPTERATLYGKRLVSSSETGEGRWLAEGLVKSLTGGDAIECRRMREDFWEFTPTHKLWLATNHKPQIRGTDHAIWRRIHLIPFGVTFHEPETGKKPQKDPTLPARLREELAGILRWAVEGCLAWQRVGLKAPKTVRDATEGYRVEMDVLAAFLEERCVFDKRAEAGASELYGAYTRWCEAAGEHAQSQTSFGTRLRERELTSHKGHRSRVWRGVGLKAAAAAASADQFSGSSHEKKSQSCKPGNGSAPAAPAADGEVF